MLNSLKQLSFLIPPLTDYEVFTVKSQAHGTPIAIQRFWRE